MVSRTSGPPDRIARNAGGIPRRKSLPRKRHDGGAVGLRAVHRKVGPLAEIERDRRRAVGIVDEVAVAVEHLAAEGVTDAELERAQAQAQDIIREARVKAGEIIDQASHRGNQMIEQAKQDALTERNRQVSAAEAEIQQAANQAREVLRTRLAELSVAGAARMIEKEIDPARHRELFDKLAAEL